MIYLVFKFNLKKLGSKIGALKAYPESFFKITSNILSFSVPISMGRLVSTLLQTATSILIPQRLVLAGYTTSEAIQTFGKITGMAMPLLFVPFTVTSALSVNIIPNISEQIALNKISDVNRQSSLAIKITLLVAIPISMLYAAFGSHLGLVIYKDLDVGRYLSIISYATIFLCMQQTTSSILHGMGKPIIATINFILGMLLQLYCTYFLISNPKYGINGFFIGYIFSAFLVFILNFISLKRTITLQLSMKELLLKPLVSSTIATCSIFYLYKSLALIIRSSFLNTILSLALGSALYLILLGMTKSLDLFSILKELRPR